MGQPAKHRIGKHTWLGPIALCLGLLSWALPVAGIPLAVGAIACGAWSIRTRGPYRIDWTAATGLGAGATQVSVSLLLLAA